jgi:hypothetical protein
MGAVVFPHASSLMALPLVPETALGDSVLYSINHLMMMMMMVILLLLLTETSLRQLMGAVVFPHASSLMALPLVPETALGDSVLYSINHLPADKVNNNNNHNNNNNNNFCFESHNETVFPTLALW